MNFPVQNNNYRQNNYPRNNNGNVPNQMWQQPQVYGDNNNNQKKFYNNNRGAVNNSAPAPNAPNANASVGSPIPDGQQLVNGNNVQNHAGIDTRYALTEILIFSLITRFVQINDHRFDSEWNEDTLN